MAALVREALAAGAIGWSTSLSPTHFFGDGTPAPSRLADAEELLELAAALRPLERGVIEVAPRSTIGPPGDKLEEQRFIARLAEASGKLVSWAPLLDNPFAPGSAAQLLAEGAALQAAGRTVVPQVGCRPLEVRFDFAEPAFYLENNPVWRPLMAKPRDERRRLFTDPGFRGELARRSFVAGLAPSWDRLVCRMPQSVGTRPWQDRSVAEIAAVRGVAAVDAFCDLVLEDDLRAQWGVVLMNHDETAVAACSAAGAEQASDDANRCRGQGRDRPDHQRALLDGAAHADGGQHQRARRRPGLRLDHAEPAVQGGAHA